MPAFDREQAPHVPATSLSRISNFRRHDFFDGVSKNLSDLLTGSGTVSMAHVSEQFRVATDHGSNKVYPRVEMKAQTYLKVPVG